MDSTTLGWLTTIFSSLALLVTGGVFVKRGSYKPAIEVLNQTLQAYKEASILQAEKEKTWKEEKAALEQEKKTLQDLLIKEKAHSAELAGIIADWTIERRGLTDRIASLEQQLKGGPPPVVHIP